MKKVSKITLLLIVGLCSLVGMQSFAADLFTPDIKFWLEGRFDYINKSQITKTGGNVTGQINQQDFQCNRVRPNAGGKVNDNLKYRVRLNLCQPDPSPLNRDNTPLIVDMAYFDDAMFDNFTLRAGKFALTEQLGWETEYSSSNVFQYSGAFTQMNTSYGYFRTGIEGTYKLWGQELKFNITTPTVTANPAVSGYQTNYGLSYALYAKGSFMDDMIQPILSYTIFNVDGTTGATPTSAATNTVAAAGVRVNPLDNLMVDVNYDYLYQPWTGVTVTNPSGATTAANVNPSTMQTWEARAFYKYGKFVPNLGFFTDNFGTTVNSAQYVDTEYEGGIWYYPYDNANFRYELEYSTVYQNNDPSATTGSVANNRLWVGFRFDIGNPTPAKTKNVSSQGSEI